MTSTDDADIGDDTINRLRDAINSHDLDRIVDSFTEDFESVLPMHPARSFVGNEHVRENWTGMLSRMPDIHARILRAVVDVRSGETWSEWELVGTSSGTPVTLRGVVISRPRDGRMAWNRFYLDPVD